MKSPTIKSDSYILRPFKTSDAELWQNWDVDREVQAFMPERLNEVQDIKQQYKYIEECEGDEEGFYWSIETKDGVTIGTVALTEFNNYHKIASLGIVIGDKNYRGKGVDKPIFLYGMGTHKPLKGFTVPHIDWNTGRIIPKLKKPSVLVGFSMGAVLACEYAITQKVDHLILCSITTGIETLKKVQANKVTFLVGEKEEWVHKDIMRIMNTLPSKCIVDVHVIPGEDHKITEKYRKKILSFLE